MGPDDMVIAAFGVLLTQVRTARRALEDVQRSTSRYMGFEFAQALNDGSRFGAPPMFQGALMVHVVNINDLAPGNSFGGFLEALLGGVGNFFGNLIGGTVGGFISSWALPAMIRQLDRIVVNIGQILDRLGIGTRTPTTPSGAATAPAAAGTGETLITTLEGLRGTVRDLTALFQAATDGPGGTAGANRAGETSQTPLTATGERWMAILDGINRLLDRTAHIVDGLILALPIVIGSIALLVTSLGSIRQALLETIQFVLRNALILRGVLLTVIFETMASAARLAASIVGILSTAIQGILTAIVAAVQALIGAAFDALGTLTNALQTIVRALLQWLVTGVFDTLRALGELAVFRTIDHLVRILPALIPPLFMLMNHGTRLPPALEGQLATAHAAAFPAGGAAGAPGTPPAAPTSVTIGAFPDITTMMQPMRAALTTAVDQASTHLQEAAQSIFGSAESALRGLAGRFEGAVTAEADFSRGILERHADRIRTQAATLAGAISAPLAAQGPATGLEEIAGAYEHWLTGGGLTSLLDQIAPHFAHAPASGEPGGPLSLLRGEFDRPRASIDIDRVEIIIEPPPLEPGAPGTLGPGDFPVPSMSDEAIYLAVMRHGAELEDRGFRPADPRAVFAV